MDAAEIHWDDLDLEGAFRLAQRADAGEGTDGVLACAQAADGAQFVLVTIPSSPEWAVGHLFFPGDRARQHMRISAIVSTVEGDLNEMGCAYEHRDVGPRYHYVTIRRSDPHSSVKARVGASAWTVVQRSAGGWLVHLERSDDLHAVMSVEELLAGGWRALM